MKKLLLTILFIGTFGLVFGQAEFITVWKTDETAGVSGGNPISSTTQVKLPISGSGITYSGSWTKVGDASKNGSFTNATLTNHVVEFGEEGNFEVIISAVTGANFAWRFAATASASDCKKLMEVKQWGNLWTFNGGNIFRGCEKMQVTATDAPLLSGDIGSMFMGCTALTGNNAFNSWNLSNVTNINQLFRDCTNFNAPINNWVTSEVTAMNNMFQSASTFNQPIGNWNTAKVTTMANMFNGASAFNQSLDSWNVALVTTFQNMFQNAIVFNQYLGSWTFKDNTVVLTNFLTATNNNGIDCINFSNTLKGWAENPLTPTGITFSSSNRKYGNQNAFDNITGNGSGQKNWTITGSTFDATCATVLPVNFTSINASISGNNLLVKWQTASEQNNDYFSIYASEDGKTWQELGKVNSKAVNGNSNTILNYEYNTAYSSTSVQLASISILGVFALAFLAFNRRNRWLISATAVICFGIFFSSCRKNDLLDGQDVTTAYRKQSNKTIYIKIIQTDKDGETSESGIVAVKN